MAPLYNSIEEALDAAKALAQRQFEIKDNRIEKLQIENNYLKSEHYKDDQLSKLKEENKELKKDMMRGFPITAEQWQEIAAWQQYHIKYKHCGRQIVGAFGGRFSYEFQPTSVGTIGICKCTCGACYQFQEE